MKSNYEWLSLIPQGWEDLARNMIEEIEIVNPSYEINDMKEKWGKLNVSGWYEDEKTYDIIHEYEEASAHVCAQCGAPATKYSAGYILPFCDECASLFPNAEFKEIKS